MTEKIELREGMGRGESFFQMAWRRFRRHPLARLGGWVLLVLYLGALFADFLAPYPEGQSFRQFSYAPPTQVFWRDADGRLTRPYVCASERKRNLETFQVEVVTDCSQGRYPIYFFVHGEPYKFLGFIPANLRLMGGDWLVNEQAHLFIWGTDDFGRDLWGRIWYGARVSLTVGIFATALALIIGVFFGGIAGLYAGKPVTLSVGFASPEFRRYLRWGHPLLAWLKALGWTLVWLGLAWLLWITLQGFLQTSRGLEAILAGAAGVLLLGAIGYFLIWQTVKLDLDTLIMRTTEVLAAIPDLFLLITLSVLIPQDIPPATRFILVVSILSFVNWGGLARTVRSQVLQLREMEYAQAAQALGASDARTLVRHILPGTFTYLIVIVTLSIPSFILAESGLSFLGLGIQEPASSWGLLLSKAQQTGIIAFTERPWLLIPGLFILIAVLAYNLLGDGLRDALDPRSRR
jgi:peptide/nickel transport system permease protein|nr:ABC transporter permease [Meiothermus sp.]